MRSFLTKPFHLSYNLDVDTRLAEETTVLVENYTVNSFTLTVTWMCNVKTYFHSFRMDVSSKWAPNGLKRLNVCSNLT